MLALGVGAVALLTYALHGVHGMLSRDLAVYSYAGQQVANGVPPYDGILNRAGPLAHAIPAIGVWIARAGGFDDVVTMRLQFMAIATLCVCAVYLLGRDVFTSRLAGLVSAATFLTFSGFIEYASNGPREKTPMTLFVTCALWAVARKHWFTAGVCVSLATLCLQIAFFSSFTAVVAGALFLAHGGRLRALARVALGGALPVAVCAAWFAAAGSLHDAVEAFLLINMRYTTPDPVLPRLDAAWLDLQEAYGVSLWLLVGGLVGTRRPLPGRGPQEREGRGVPGGGAGRVHPGRGGGPGLEHQGVRRLARPVPAAPLRSGGHRRTVPRADPAAGTEDRGRGGGRAVRGRGRYGDPRVGDHAGRAVDDPAGVGGRGAEAGARRTRRSPPSKRLRRSS